jgi:hypothetical protein
MPGVLLVQHSHGLADPKTAIDTREARCVCWSLCNSKKATPWASSH